MVRDGAVVVGALQCGGPGCGRGPPPAGRDGHTGLANRRHFDVSLATEWARAQRACQPLGLGLLDVGHFKA